MCLSVKLRCLSYFRHRAETDLIFHYQWTDVVWRLTLAFDCSSSWPCIPLMSCLDLAWMLLSCVSASLSFPSASERSCVWRSDSDFTLCNTAVNDPRCTETDNNTDCHWVLSHCCRRAIKTKAWWLVRVCHLFARRIQQVSSVVALLLTAGTSQTMAYILWP